METKPLEAITPAMISDPKKFAETLNQNFTIQSNHQNLIIGKLDGIEFDIKEMKSDIKTILSILRPNS